MDSLKSATPFRLNRAREVKKSEVPIEKLLRARPACRACAIERAAPRAVEGSVDRSGGGAIGAAGLDPCVGVPFTQRRRGEACHIGDRPGRHASCAGTKARYIRTWRSKATPWLWPTCAGKRRYVARVSARRGRTRTIPSNRRRFRMGLDDPGQAAGGAKRATDILAMADALRRHPPLAGKSRLVLAAGGRFTLPALFAAALDPKITQLYLSGGLVSYRSIVDTEEYNAPFAGFVPDILLHTDLPAIAASRAPARMPGRHGRCGRRAPGRGESPRPLCRFAYRRAGPGAVGRGKPVAMKAALLRAPQPVEHNPLELSDAQAPNPGPTDVLVRVIACGVCRTDLHRHRGRARSSVNRRSPPSRPPGGGHGPSRPASAWTRFRQGRPRGHCLAA